MYFVRSFSFSYVFRIISYFAYFFVFYFVCHTKWYKMIRKAYEKKWCQESWCWRTWQFCQDFRGFKASKQHSVVPFPQVDQLIDETRSSRFFSKQDLPSTYHQFRIRPGEETNSWFLSGSLEANIMMSSGWVHFGFTACPPSWCITCMLSLGGLIQCLTIPAVGDRWLRVGAALCWVNLFMFTWTTCLFSPRRKKSIWFTLKHHVFTLRPANARFSGPLPPSLATRFLSEACLLLVTRYGPS